MQERVAEKIRKAGIAQKSHAAHGVGVSLVSAVKCFPRGIAAASPARVCAVKELSPTTSGLAACLRFAGSGNCRFQAYYPKTATRRHICRHRRRRVGARFSPPAWSESMLQSRQSREGTRGQTAGGSETGTQRLLRAAAIGHASCRPRRVSVRACLAVLPPTS